MISLMILPIISFILRVLVAEIKKGMTPKISVKTDLENVIYVFER